jgi:hypothetical protein
MQDIDWQNETTGMRRDFEQLLAACLDRQVGTHILDEIILWEAKIEGRELVMGRACYSHLLVPSCSILHEKTVAKLKALDKAGIRVSFSGRTLPTRMQTEDSIEPLDLSWLPEMSAEETAASLPRLIELGGDATDIRCTAWRRGGKTTRLLMNLRETPWRGKADGKAVKLEPGKVVVG